MKHFFFALGMVSLWSLTPWTILAQNYELTRPVDDSLLKEINVLVKEVLTPDFPYEYSCTGYDLVPSLEKIPKGINYSKDYKILQEENLKTNPQNALAWNNLANYYNAVDDKEKAKDNFIKALQYLDLTISKDSSLYYSFRGTLKMNLGMGDFSEDFEKALSMNPKDSLAIFAMPYVLLGSGDAEKSESYCLQQMSKSWDYVQACWFLNYYFVDFIRHFNLIDVNSVDDEEFLKTDVNEFYNLSDVEKIYKKYKKNPKIVVTYKLMEILPLSTKFMLFASQRNFSPSYTKNEQKTMADLHRFFGDKNHSPVNEFTRLKTLAFVTVLECKLDSAAQLFREAIDVLPAEKRSSSFDIGVCQKALLAINMLKDDNRANIQLLLEMVEMYRNKVLLPSTVTNLARCYLQEDDFASFKKYAQQAEELSGSDFEMLRLMAHVSFVENSPQVNYYLQKAMENVSDNDDVINLMCQVALYFIARGDATQARQYFQEARKVDPETECELCDRVEKEYIRVKQ